MHDVVTFFVLLCDHERDSHLMGIRLTCCVTVVFSVARTIYINNKEPDLYTNINFILF